MGEMSDRGWLFLGSVLLIVLSLAASGWLVVTSQVRGLDGLFLLLVCLTTALAFALYAWSVIRSVRDEISGERAPKPPGKKGPGA
jgi:hypothetical protein